MSIIAMISGEWNNLSELTSYTGQASVSSTQKRTGNYSIKLTGGSGVFMQRTFPAKDEVYLQFGWFAINNFNGVTFSLRLGATALVSFGRNTSNLLEIRSGWNGTLLATGVTPILNNTWYVIEFHFKLADSGGVAELRVDGNLECTFNGDTKPGSETTIDNLYWVSWASGPEYYIDDVVVHDTSGSVNNSWPSGLKLCLLKPTSDGATKEWTPSTGEDHYALVDEVPPSGTDYLQAATNDLIDIFNLEDLPEEAQSIKAIALEFYGLKNSSASPTKIAQIAYVDNVPYEQADQNLGFAQSLVRKILETNPAGGDWNITSVNNLQLGIKSKA